ncbi:cell wall metabolism sensor histidine kinase WalK [Halalkalibacter sp. APA_J-10(15)]|uniref:cell wall metabolism sensor histidine kinase WalK n=1 Tax=unclassified Halalkalibacter TaxID=2893063 RepID=UPI001FF262C8|nr:cell wall metabolism sensor histidine kinase WalK [Halalkalibacter sp. APA_J-10(15)]MCK0469812.1 cell wall metabolism sensor histidine kinase WalK [Halalkalibacter sp. APA_J-10(15)]
MNEKVGFFKSIQFKLIIIYVLIIFVAMQVVGVYFTNQLESQMLENYYEMLDERANLLAYNIAQEIESQHEERSELISNINVLLRDIFSIEHAEVQVIDQNKVVISTSNLANRQIVGQQTTEVRVKRALLGTPDEALLRDPSNGQRVRVFTVPINIEEDTVGALYIEASIEEIYDQTRQITTILISGVFIATIISIILFILLARTITAPIIDMRKQALRMGRGDFTNQVSVYSGDEIGQLAMSFNDLTMKLRDATVTRDREQKRLKSVLTHMTDGVMSTDQDGNIILMNKRAEELLSVTSEQAVGKSIVELLHLEEQTVEDLYEQADSILLDFSYDEEAFLLEANFSVIQEESGPVNGLIIVLHDVTEEEKIEQDRREFVANVSHELRTPLTTMKSYLEALEDGALADPEIAPRFLHVTQNETDRMIRLVKDLLQLSKIDSDDYQLNLETVEINRYLDETIERFEMIASNKNIDFHRKLNKKSIYADIDRDKMTQVLDNIISNAMKYSPEGGTVKIRLLLQGKNIRMSISDQGMGIPRESQTKIFERFYRVDKARARSVGGTGLGLAIAKELIQAHGGHIWAQSEYGKGTTIFITLPYASKGAKS